MIIVNPFNESHARHFSCLVFAKSTPLCWSVCSLGNGVARRVEDWVNECGRRGIAKRLETGLALMQNLKGPLFLRVWR